MSIIAFELLDCFECLGWDSSWDCLPITSHKDHAFSLLEDAAATCYNCTVTQSRMKCWMERYLRSKVPLSCRLLVSKHVQYSYKGGLSNTFHPSFGSKTSLSPFALPHPSIGGTLSEMNSCYGHGGHMVLPLTTVATAYVHAWVCCFHEACADAEVNLTRVWLWYKRCYSSTLHLTILQLRCSFSKYMSVRSNHKSKSIITLTTHLKLFFISRKAAMTSTGSVLPVAFWTSEFCEVLVNILERRL